MDALMNNKTDKGRETIYSLYKDIQRMVKNNRWKMIRYRHSAETGQGSDAVQLFDLLNDPWELDNLASDPRYRPQLEELKRDLADWMARSGDSYAHLFQ